MKKSVLILVGAVLGFASSGALYAAGVTRERALNNFTAISLEDVGTVNIHFSPTYKVIVTTDSDSLQGFLTTESSRQHFIYQP